MGDLPHEHPMSILEPIFTPGYKGRLQMPSGRTLKVITTEATVSLEDLENQRYHFLAGQTEADGKDAVYFSIDSKDKHVEKRRHPDLYAARLMLRSLQYFENATRGGKPIPRLATTWYTEPGASDNYTQYIDNLHKYGHDQTERAALDTWTGKQALKLGFVTVAGTNELELDFLEVYFDRPESFTSRDPH